MKALPWHQQPVRSINYGVMIQSCASSGDDLDRFFVLQFLVLLFILEITTEQIIHMFICSVIWTNFCELTTGTVPRKACAPPEFAHVDGWLGVEAISLVVDGTNYNVNPGLINHGLLIRGVLPKESFHLILFYGIPPIKQPFGVY